MDNKITLPGLAAMIASRTGLTKRLCEDFIRELFLQVGNALLDGESVKIKDLGTFRLSKVEPRMSVDVVSGEPIQIPGHRKVVFVPSKELAEGVNTPFEAFEPLELADDFDESMLDLPAEGVISKENIQQEVSEGETIESDSIESRYNESREEVLYLLDSDEAEDSNNSIEDFKTENIEIIESATDDLKVDYQKTEIKPSDISEVQDSECTSDSSEKESSNDAIKSKISNQIKESNKESEPERDSINRKIISLGFPEPSEDEEVHPVKRSRKAGNRFGTGFLIGFLCCIVVFGVLGWIGYRSLLGRIENLQSGTISKSEKDMIDIPDIVDNEVVSLTEIADTSVSEAQPLESLNIDEVTELKEPSRATSSEKDIVADTQPSDKKVYDTITRTRYLTTMAKEHYGNFNLWPYIYEENKNFLGHPDRIKPGTKVVIPPLSKYGVDPKSATDLDKARKMGAEIYARYK